MKNIHVLPTDKPSRLYLFEERLILGDLVTVVFKNSGAVNQNIYITSDEEIKEGDWVLFISTNEVIKVPLGGFKGKVCKKIILTTDQDLIKDGIQEIDDEFLEWFVKNPSCERVEVEEVIIIDFEEVSYEGDYQAIEYIDYKIIIPKEELKQETLEEAAERYASHSLKEERQKDLKIGFIYGAKWQRE